MNSDFVSKLTSFKTINYLAVNSYKPNGIGHSDQLDQSISV